MRHFQLSTKQFSFFFFISETKYLLANNVSMLFTDTRFKSHSTKLWTFEKWLTGFWEFELDRKSSLNTRRHDIQQDDTQQSGIQSGIQETVNRLSEIQQNDT